MKVKQSLLVLITLIMATAFFSCSLDMPEAESLSDSAVSRTSASECMDQQNYCFTVDYSRESTGDGAIKSCSTKSGTYVQGTEIVVAAAPCEVSNSCFTGWYDAPCDGKLISKESTYSFQLKCNTKLYARFDKECQTNYSLTIDYWAKSSADGDVRKSTSSGTYKEGTEITAVAEPCLEQNAYFAGWYDAKYEGNLVSKEATYRFKLTANTALYARFDKGGTTPPDPTDPTNDNNFIHFPDPALEMAVRKKIYKANGKLTREDVAQIDWIIYKADSNNPPIKDLTGIEHLTGLVQLILENNKLNDLAPLGKLKYLRDLYMTNNQLSDISSLPAMDSLVTLQLDRNQISDITALTRLKNLTTLYLKSNHITDLKPLANLKGLRLIILDENRISDITPLNSLDNLYDLRLNRNQIEDISRLKGLKGLSNLELTNNQITTLPSVIELPTLKKLNLSNNRITVFPPVLKPNKLDKLNLNNNSISDTTPFQELTGLSSLELGGNKIYDIKPLSTMTNLSNLSLHNNQISDISPLKGLTRLYTLKLQHNKISDISFLKNLTRLNKIDLSNNQISDISGLKGLNLSITGLQHNRISDITTLIENPDPGPWFNRTYLFNNNNIPQAQIKALEAKGVNVWLYIGSDDLW